MKLLSTALLGLITISSMAHASNGHNIKVSDGGTAHCKTKADVYRHKFGAYQTRLKSIIVDRDFAEVNIETSFLACVEEDGKVGFKSVRPYDSFSYQSLTFNNGIQTVEVRPELIKMISYKDGVYKKIADLKLDNKQKQIVTLKLKLDDILSAKDQEDLENGKVVLGDFDYTLQKFIKFDDDKTLRPMSFGSFRIHFKAVIDRDYSLKIIGL